MQIKLINSLEDWRNSSEVQRVIDAAEKESGFSADSYDVYDDFIGEFRRAVARYLHNQGHSVTWWHQQSRGIGCIWQGWSEAGESAFDQACDACTMDFFYDCVAFGKSELQK
jgi:hypothetical protein